MRTLKQRVAAVTGAASGIGRALACELAREGCDLALSDVDEVGLEDTRRRAEAASGRALTISTRRVDVADREAVFAWAAAVEERHGAAHMVFNNAGVALTVKLREVEFADFEWLMNINFWGVVNGTRAFLPILERQDEGHVVNVSSVFGIIAAPRNGSYNAAKFAVRGFTEALRIELELDGLPIGVTCVHPGGIKTNIARAARTSEGDETERDRLATEFEQKMARTTPESCARQIIAGVKRNARRVLVGADARAIDVIQRVLPTGYQRLVTRLGRRHWR